MVGTWISWPYSLPFLCGACILEARQITIALPGEPAFDGIHSRVAETSGREVYSPLEQAILLALAEQQRRTTAKDEMRPWQVAAFSDTVLVQSSTRYLLRRAAKLNRSVIVCYLLFAGPANTLTSLGLQECLHC